ncbi:hypothetical protein J8J40_21405 [Mycobacterium tuberculosis]|nr:hypothetical protein [Mycobacterium tuberculosis]
MPATLIDGKAFAAKLSATVAEAVAALKTQGIKPGLATVLVGDDPASSVYVASKGRETLAAGMASFSHRLPADTREADLLALLGQLNADDAVDVRYQLLSGRRHHRLGQGLGGPDRQLRRHRRRQRLRTGDPRPATVRQRRRQR